MSLKMLVDAHHKEETRVAVIQDKKLVEYDFEATTKQTVKSNIYLAKVMRVEPSLQAAFVDFGGNRHGFLAFSEIHPDYFRIPISDREALNAKLKDAASDPDEDEFEDEENLDASEEQEIDETTIDYDMAVSTIAGESIAPIDEVTEGTVKRPPLHKMYKIQEVIHKNQILLIQVVKEERGQKGAALTTYLSLAGRYCVLMPNSPQAGGISRKISNASDRKSLRDILKSLEIPPEMGLIIRTAGQGRTKSEIKRDTDYLKRLWNEIREETLSSTAPALIYQEDNIIKRSIRDQYHKDIDEVLVQGEESYKLAKNFMKKLLPSHAKKVKQYKNELVPLFIQHKIEPQIEAMHESTVMLPSGGSIVINPTEALVAIDINSGRATRERHIEETALNTNLEAATEIARQVRLRDLAGLIVIDFIDMYDRRYTAQVEKRVREAFKNDRARVQMSKISPFGLLELSRQRLRPSILETSSTPCSHCHATGFVRSVESLSLQILRALQEEGISKRTHHVKAMMPYEVAFYLLNDKRADVLDVEARYNMKVDIFGDRDLISPEFKLIQLETRAVATKKQKVSPENLPDKPKQTDKPAAEDDQKRATPRKRPKRAKPKTAEGGSQSGQPSGNQRETKGEDNTNNDVRTEDNQAQEIQSDDKKNDSSKNRRRRPRSKRPNKQNQQGSKHSDNKENENLKNVKDQSQSQSQKSDSNKSDKGQAGKGHNARTKRSSREPAAALKGDDEKAAPAKQHDSKAAASPQEEDRASTSLSAAVTQPQALDQETAVQSGDERKLSTPKQRKKKSWLKRLLD